MLLLLVPDINFSLFIHQDQRVTIQLFLMPFQLIVLVLNETCEFIIINEETAHLASKVMAVAFSNKINHDNIFLWFQVLDLPGRTPLLVSSELVNIILTWTVKIVTPTFNSNSICVCVLDSVLVPKSKLDYTV